MSNKPNLTLRQVAAESVWQVLGQQRSLTAVLDEYRSQVISTQQALWHELVVGTLRWEPQLTAMLNELLHKPLRKRDQRRLLGILLIGLYQLHRMRLPHHAVINETVAAAGKQSALKNLVNAILRHYLRRIDDWPDWLNQQPLAIRAAHPEWLVKALQQDWPEQANEILQANNQQAPLVLRINHRKISREQYLDHLPTGSFWLPEGADLSSAVVLKRSQAVEQLPGYQQGWFSIQDLAGQHVPRLLKAQDGMRVLDACAAPGGKASHIMECHDVSLVALDRDHKRLQRLRDNMQRLQLTPTKTMAVDACDVEAWWDGQLFDRIVLDAPCSALGVIRRHPDIKSLRHAADIKPLITMQRRLLAALWPLLKPGGELLYITCSWLRCENDEQIAHWLQQCDTAGCLSINGNWGQPTRYGRQLLPGDSDGFYYARLQRLA